MARPLLDNHTVIFQYQDQDYHQLLGIVLKFVVLTQSRYMSGCELELSLVHELSDLHIDCMHLSEIYLLYN